MTIIIYHECLLLVHISILGDKPILISRGEGAIHMPPPIPTVEVSEVTLRRVKRVRALHENVISQKYLVYKNKLAVSNPREI